MSPALAEDHTVVLADLRGYGDSDKPAPDTASLVYSKLAMARDQVGVMRRLGFESFQPVGYDRGTRAGHRLVLDHPDAVTRFAVLDIVPTQYALRHLTLPAVTANYQWFFLSTGRGIPEHMIAAGPGFWVREQTAQLIGAGASIEPKVMADYIRCFRDQQAIAAICASFRASRGPDLDHDEESIAAGQKIECPVLVPWARKVRPARATIRPLSGRRTRPMSAAWPCLPTTSSPRKRHAWSLTRYEISSTNKRTTRITSAARPQARVLTRD